MIKLYRNFISLLLLIEILSLPFSSIAQDTLRYTLDDVIAIAQDQSPDAQIAKHRYRRSYWGFRTFKADYLPSLRLDATIPNLNVSFEEQYNVIDSTINFLPQSRTSYSVGLSVNQKIGITGGEVFLSTSLHRLENDISKNYTLQYLTNMVNIGIRQPIFKYNPYKFNRKIEPLLFEEAQRLYIETNEEVAITAVNHFFSLLLAQIEVEIAYKNYANYDTLYKIAIGRYNLGKIAENELLQLELNRLTAEASVENTELDYTNKLFVFNSFLRLKDGTPIILIPPVITPYFAVPAQDAVDLAKDNSSTGIEFTRRILEAESELYRAKRDGRFDAEIFASFGLTQSAATVPDAYKNPYNEEMVDIGLTMPILDWGKARGNIKMAQSNLDLVETSIEQEKIDFEQSVFLQVMRFNMQKKQLRIAAKSDTVAQKRFEITQKRYMIGKVNDVLELDKAQIDNDNAKLGYYRSLMTYWRSFYDLRKLTLYDFQRNMPITTNFDDLMN